MATVTVDVDADMADLEDAELIDELRDRGYAVTGKNEDAQDVFPLLLKMGYPESLIRGALPQNWQLPQNSGLCLKTLKLRSLNDKLRVNLNTLGVTNGAISSPASTFRQGNQGGGCCDH